MDRDEGVQEEEGPTPGPIADLECAEQVRGPHSYSALPAVLSSAVPSPTMPAEGAAGAGTGRRGHGYPRG